MSQMPLYNSVSTFRKSCRRVAAVTAKASASVIYEVPPTRGLMVTNITICNTSSSRVTIRLHHVGAGETANVGNALFYDLEMQGNTTISDDAIRFLMNGEKVFAQASTASVVSFLIYGEET
jgi:hypothetical protein